MKKMTKGYAAPEVPQIVKPERMVPKIPRWIKKPIFYLALSYFAINLGGFIRVNNGRNEELSKSKIEEKLDDYVNDTVLVKFVFDDLSKPGREVAYLIYGDGEE